MLELGNPKGRLLALWRGGVGTPQGITVGGGTCGPELASGHHTLPHLTCFIPELPYPGDLGLPAQPSCGVFLVCHDSNWVLKDVHKGS